MLNFLEKANGSLFFFSALFTSLLYILQKKISQGVFPDLIALHYFINIFYTFLLFFTIIFYKFLSHCLREEPMTKVTGFQQSVRLFQSYDPVTPSILSSFLLHLSDAFPSGRVLLRLSVRHPYADSPTAVQALKVDFHHGSHASPRYRCFVIWLFPFPECLSTCDWFYPLLC